jgi:glycosyl transferase family 25
MEGCDDRRKSISAQLNSLGLEFEFFNAINPKKNIEFQQYYNSARAKNIYKRDLTLGELGCSLSHQHIYKMLIQDTSDYYLILEDDAIINGNIIYLLAELTSIKKEWDVILLGYSKVSSEYYEKLNKFHPIGKSVFNFKGHALGEVYKNSTCGTVGYLITKNGAGKLINNDCVIYNLADDWVYFEKKRSLKILHCRPFLVYEDFVTFESSIEKDRATVSKKAINLLLRNQLLYLRGLFLLFVLRVFR